VLEPHVILVVVAKLLWVRMLVGVPLSNSLGVWQCIIQATLVINRHVVVNPMVCQSVVESVRRPLLNPHLTLLMILPRGKQCHHQMVVQEFIGQLDY
jgi:hypothetical protein